MTIFKGEENESQPEFLIVVLVGISILTPSRHNHLPSKLLQENGLIGPVKNHRWEIGLIYELQDIGLKSKTSRSRGYFGGKTVVRNGTPTGWKPHQIFRRRRYPKKQILDLHRYLPTSEHSADPAPPNEFICRPGSKAS